MIKFVTIILMVVLSFWPATGKFAPEDRAERLKTLELVKESLDLKAIGKELFISEERAQALERANFFGIDTSSAYLSEDPFTNRVCRGAAKAVIKSFNNSGTMNMGDWYTFRADFIEASNPENFEKIMSGELSLEETDRLREDMMTDYQKLKNPVDEHVTVYNPRLDILVDLTYRQFLLGKISDDAFKALPKIFIGTIAEFRRLIQPHLGKAKVDELLYSREMLQINYDSSAPLLRDYENMPQHLLSGGKGASVTFEDEVIPPPSNDRETNEGPTPPPIVEQVVN